MSLPSYEIFKTGGSWWCEGKMPSGRAFRFECGRGSKEAAHGFAESKLHNKIRSSEGSQKRWARWREAKARGETDGVRIGRPPKNPDQPVSAPPAAAAAAEDLRAKLLGLGDAQPIAPDDVIPASEDGGAGARGDEDPPMDNEGGELIASILAKGATIGLVAMTNARLKKRKPPQHAEPHEKGLQWFHEGLEFHFKRLLGKTASLGPTGKIFAGAAIIVGSMYMNAEPIDPPPPGQQQQETAPPAAPPEHESAPQPAPAEHSNGTTALTRARALGVFGVERRVAN